jgi:phage tail-like protein
MHGLFEEGAFQGTTPDRAYFVKCDADTTTKHDIDRGIVNIVVGFTPLKPAEFVVIKIQQIATSVGIGASASVSSGLDPYASFRFRIMWQGRYVAGAAKLGGLKRTSEIVKDNQSLTASQQKAAQRSKYEAITLERGVTHDREFENWASEVAEREDAAGSKSSRRAILIGECDEPGHFVQSYRLVRAWVSDEASPDLDASANAVTIETIKLENEGWRRDVVCEG